MQSIFRLPGLRYRPRGIPRRSPSSPAPSRPGWTTPLALAASLLFSLAAGCSSMIGDSRREPVEGFDTTALRAAGYNFDGEGTQRAIPPNGEKPSITLEVRTKKRHLERVPLTVDKPTFLQDVIDDAQLVKKLGKIKVTLLRPTEPNQPPIRMDADYDGDTRRIVTGQNYALQPNDQLIVVKDTSSWLDNFGLFTR
jgi:hypothetical protein